MTPVSRLRERVRAGTARPPGTALECRLLVANEALRTLRAQGTLR
ncbi:hypothetical protein [Streptomyces colonosanans]|nr:hypothetical protein [Streptomyces colonosanans]